MSNEYKMSDCPLGGYSASRSIKLSIDGVYVSRGRGNSYRETNKKLIIVSFESMKLTFVGGPKLIEALNTEIDWDSKREVSDYFSVCLKVLAEDQGFGEIAKLVVQLAEDQLDNGIKSGRNNFRNEIRELMGMEY